MSDPGTRKADASQDVIAHRLRQIYGEAVKDITARLDKFAKRHAEQDRKMRADLAAGKITKAQYKDWQNGQIFQKKTWEAQVVSLTSTMMTANEQANRIIEGERRAVFGENATYQAYKLENDANMDLGFTVYDQAAVTRLLRNQPGLLPEKKLNGQKISAWNRRTIASQITRGILSGESVEDIAKHLAEALGSANEKSMLRYARTAMTGAQNAGRMEVLEEAQEMGVKVRKEWLATLDDRTRDAHAELDGQVQDVDQPFHSSLGPIMYPGDPSADPANVWNCRCTLVYDYIEYPKESATRYDQLNGEVIEDMTYEEWKEWAD